MKKGILAASCALTLNAFSALASDHAILNEAFPYVALDRPLGSVFADFTRFTGVPAILGDGARGTITYRNPDADVRTFLDAAASQTGLIWWRDGGSVRLDPAVAVQSSLIALNGAGEAEVLGRLDELDLLQDRFSIRATADGEMLRVSGPDAYRDAVREVVESLAPAANANQVERATPRVFRGNRGSGG